MYLFTEWEGRTGKYLARGQHVRTERYCGTDYFRQLGIELLWKLRDTVFVIVFSVVLESWIVNLS